MVLPWRFRPRVTNLLINSASPPNNLWKTNMIMSNMRSTTIPPRTKNTADGVFLLADEDTKFSDCSWVTTASLQNNVKVSVCVCVCDNDDRKAVENPK